MNRKPYSMIKFLQFIYTSITLFLLTILFIFVFHSLHTVKEQFTTAQQQSLNIYMAELDQSLEKISSSLRQYQIREGFPDFNGLDSGELYRTKQEISSDFSSNILFLNYCEGLFLYDQTNDEYLYVFNSASQEQTYNTRLAIKEIAAGMMKDSGLAAAANWYLTEIEGRPYVLYLQWQNESCYGSWVSAAKLLPAVSDLSAYEDTILFLTDSEDRCIASTLDADLSKELSGQPYITAAVSSSVAPFVLSSSTPESHYLSTMSFSLRILLLVSILALMTIVVAYVSLKRVVKNPLNQVLHTIARYEAGDLDFVPNDQKMPGEIIHINHALADMSQEIKTLKIDVYEKQLRLKDIQLQYLQHQIKPHFVINILNTISLMVQMKENQKIISIINYLSKYMRNMMNLNIRTATLHQELEQLENYLNLQRIRYPDQITVRYDIEPELENFPIPILTVQTLVENIFKHALEPYKPLEISIFAAVVRDQAILTVRDNGCGFSEELMKDFNGNPSASGDGQHIGLINIRQRLYLECADSASMQLHNDSGAVITISLPYNTSADTPRP